MRLTIAYTVVLLVMFAAFAIGVYAFVASAFDFDAIDVDEEIAIDAADVGFATLRRGLEIGFAILVVIAPIASYLMARAALRPIKRSYDLQRAFVDGASHELRTPLSVIRGELELSLTRARTPAQYRRAIATSVEEVDGLIHLADDLLLLSRDTLADLESTFETVDLHELAKSVVSTTSAADGGHAVTVESTSTAPIRVTGSPELLRRALQNVVDNAQKYSPVGSPITVRTGLFQNSGVIEVRDSGSGMTATDVAHAFERFWRADAARTQRGHGLGLALVRHIIRAHSGDVTITSQPGTGSIVRLTVPLRDG